MISTITRASRSMRTLASAILLMLFLLPASSHAADVTVGCFGGSGGAYPSINAALAAIGPVGPSTITVTGTCTESVGLFKARSITIVAPVAGGAGSGGATIVGLQDNDTFDIGLFSQNIALQNLEIRGNPASSIGLGVSIFNNSQANIILCNIHDNPDGGVSADSSSQVALDSSILQNSSNGDGLDVTNDSTADMVSTTIQNNGGFGITVFNRSGIVIRRQNLIQNNAGGVGISAVDSSKVQMQTADPALFTTIQRHALNGIQIGDQVMLRMGGGPHAIQGNGSACPTDPTCGGISALRNSTMRLTSGNISGNQGSGISAEQLVDFGLNNTTISNNTGDGVHIRRISIGQFVTANTITGNGGASVSCDTTSLVVGDLSTFSKIACSQIERTLGPPRPGNPKQPHP
jgi:Right handed beta helix region